MKSLKALLLFILVALLVWPVSTPIHAAGAVHVEARYEQASNQQAMLRMALVNDDTQALTNLSFRYFMDLTEVIKAGYSSSNVKLDMYYSSATATVSPIKVFDAAKNIYYYEVSFGTYSLAKSSRIEANFSIHLNGWQQVWNSANDHSFTGLTNSMATTQYIPVYQSGTIIYGKEPSGYDTTPPAVPTGLKATAVSTSQINLDWADNTETDLAKYRIYAGTSSGSLNFVAETTTSSYNHMALIADTTYYYQITAVDASGNESTRTTVTSATTLKETAFTVSIGDNNGLPGQTLMVPIKFSSIPASGVSSCRFAIQYDSAVLEANRVSPGTIVIDSSEFSYNCKNDISPGEAIILFIDPTLQDYPVKTDGIFALVEFTIKAGAPAGNYRLRIEPTDASFTSIVGENIIGITNVSYSDGTIKVNDDTTPPATPTGLIATAVSASQINLDWADNNETDLAKYRIYAGTSSGSLSLLGETTTSTYNHTGLTSNTTYYYQVTAVDASGNESAKTTIASAKTLGNDITPPAAPTGLTATAVSASQINLDWADNTETDLAKYRIYAGTSSGSLSLVGETTTSVYNHTGLASNTTYYYQVTAVDASGNESAKTTIASAKTLGNDITPPAAPTGLTATAVSTSQINLDWADNTETDLVKYLIYAGTSSGSLSFVAETMASSYNHTGLAADTTYYYQVTAVDSNGNESLPSQQVSAKTQTGTTGKIHVEARYDQASSQASQIRMYVINDDTKAYTNLTTRYFLDLSEVIAAGYSASNVTVDMYYASTTTTISSPKVFNAAKNLYYIEFSWGSYSLPVGGRIENNFSIHLNGWQSVWNGANDWSFIGLTTSSAKTLNIPVYQSGTLIYGKEPNNSPTISITDPVAGSEYTAPVTITIKATAADVDGTVSKVEFYTGTLKLGEDSTAPYEYVWSGMDPGKYTLTAKATDDGGAETTSTAVGIVINPPDTDPPTVSITSPLDGATLEAPADIIIGATAADSDGTVTKVEFYNGTTKIGEATTAPYTFTWTNVPMGTYYLIATAIDNLGAKGTSAQVKVVVSSDNAYLDHFLELYQDLHTKGYLSQEGVPYHCIETMIIEGPDYGHLTTSEAFSFYIWLEAMYGRITQDWTKLQTAWEIMEKYIIPSHQDQPTNDFQKVNSPSTYAPEYLLPDYYPTTMDSSAPVGPDPLFTELKTTYGTSDIYGMHWLLDVDNWYGYGNRGDGTSRCSYINNYQRGPQESTWETVPHPSWEVFKWGGPNGFLDLFLKGGTYAPQWRYTNAPDADARAIQALYWAKMWADEQGGSAIVDALVPKAAKMGDYLRYSFFDKHFKPIGCTDPKASVGTNPYDSCHYLMSWYYSWGGAVDATAGWAFRIGCSYSHFGYQNPLAAYVLGNLTDFAPLSPNAVRDWKASLQRQVEFYRWLQTADGAIAGGCTNSWEGAYKVPPVGTTTFYKMAYDVSPSYLDPPSNRWFGMQAWSMERMAEYLYVSKDTNAKVILDKWVKWVKASVKLYADGNYEIPCDLTWSGQPGTNWDATHQNWDPADTAFNSNLRVSITNYTQDTGVTAALAKALIYYAKATGDNEARVLAKELLDRMWALFRDDKGVSCPEPRSDYNRIFDQTVYIPSGWSGEMANGDPIKPGVKFIDIRSKYREDPDWHIVEEAYNNKSAPVFHYHRFWGNADIALAYATYGLMFP